MIPSGKSKRLNVDRTIQHNKHLLEEHGSTSPGSPKPHSREIASQRSFGLLFLCKMSFEPIFVLDITALFGLELET